MDKLRDKVIAAIRNNISVTVHPEEDVAYDYEVDPDEAADAILDIPEIREALNKSAAWNYTKGKRDLGPSIKMNPPR